MKISETLDAAADLILQPGKWTREVYARDAHGNRCLTTSPDAACFCALGAVSHVERLERGAAFTFAAMECYTVLGTPLDSVNDGATTPDAPAAALRALAEHARKAGL